MFDVGLVLLARRDDIAVEVLESRNRASMFCVCGWCPRVILSSARLSDAQKTLINEAAHCGHVPSVGRCTDVIQCA